MDIKFTMLLFVSMTVFIMIICYLPIMLLSFRNYKSYKETYETLVSYKYIFLSDPYQLDKTYQTYVKKDDMVSDMWLAPHITLLPSGSVKLLNGKILVNSPMSYFDPYTLYYLIKFKKWKKQYGGIEYTLDIKRNKVIEEILS